MKYSTQMCTLFTNKLQSNIKTLDKIGQTMHHVETFCYFEIFLKRHRQQTECFAILPLKFSYILL